MHIRTEKKRYLPNWLRVGSAKGAYCKDSVSEEWYEYNADGKLVHSKDSHGNEGWREYNADGNLLSERHISADGEETLTVYDGRGNLLSENRICAEGEERLSEYDGRGNIVYRKNPHGYETLYEYEYWENGNIKQRVKYNTVDGRD